MDCVVGHIHLLTRVAEGTTTADDLAAYPFELKEEDANMLNILVHERGIEHNIEPVASVSAIITLGQRIWNLSLLFVSITKKI